MNEHYTHQEKVESKELTNKFLETVLIKAVENKSSGELDFDDLLLQFKRNTCKDGNVANFDLETVRDEISARVIRKFNPGKLNPETLVRAYVLLSDYIHIAKSPFINSHLK